MSPVSSPLAAQPKSPAAEMGMPLDEQYSYWMALLFVRDKKRALKALKEIGKRLARDFGNMLQAMEDSSGFERAGPLERLHWYRVKPDELWLEQEAKFPRRYDRDRRDYEKLQERALAGDFGVLEQAIETAMIVQEQEMVA